MLAIAYTTGTVLLAIFLSNTLFKTTLYRITNTSSVSELTTGRSVLLEVYGREILSSNRTVLFGKGMSAQILKKGTHNLFLEIQYYTGLIGLIMYIFYFGSLIVGIWKKFITNSMASKLFNYSPLIVFIALFSSLQGMVSVSVYTLLYLAVISVGIPQNENLQGERLLS